MLRTEELLAAHRLDDAEQYFCRAVDFGFSFSIEETFEKWAKEEIVGGGQHHQASAVLAAQAFRDAANPAKFPEQVKEGLRPWQPKKLYQMVGFGPVRDGEAAGPNTVSVDLDVYDTLLGRTYAEIGSQARSMHKCQGMPQVLTLPGRSAGQYRLADSTLPPGTGLQLFDGIDTSITALSSYASGKAPDALRDGLAAIARAVDEAESAYRQMRTADVGRALVSGLTTLRRLRSDLRTTSREISMRSPRSSRRLHQNPVHGSPIPPRLGAVRRSSRAPTSAVPPAMCRRATPTRR